MKALIENPEEADPEELAQLAKGKLRRKIPELMEALNGKMDKHHAMMLQMVLEHLVFISEQIEELDKLLEEKTEQQLSRPPKRQKMTIVYTILLGCTEAETEKKMRISQQAVHKLKQRALEKLRKEYLKDEYWKMKDD